jgi:hypothetical protein
MSASDSLWELTSHLTLPTNFSYQQFSLSFERSWSPLIPLSRTGSQVLLYLLTGVGAWIVLAYSWRLVQKKRILYSLWFLAIGVLLLQPFALHHYLIIAIPAVFSLALSPNLKFKTVAAIVYLLIGLARFRGLWSAIMPYPLALFGAHLSVIALLMLLVSLQFNHYEDRWLVQGGQ